MRRLRTIPVVGALAFTVFAAALWFWSEPRVAVANLPTRISDADFWQIVSDFSEPGGYFRSDNFVSNERQFQWVIDELKKDRAPGGVYLGVGPDQNFTYLVALQPRIAFIVDIRRQNMLQHLMYKALLELSTDRADFLSRLFSRSRPEDLSAEDSADKLLQAYIAAEPVQELFDRNYQSITGLLTQQRGFVLSEEDLNAIHYVFHAFFDAGPNLTYSFGAGQNGFGGRRGMPTYAQLMTETDAEGHNRSYLASAENFRVLQDLEKRNVVVPLVGDFAGPHALRAVAAYLKDHGATVTAFYTSNVEQYLFQQNDDWSNFYKNVEALPIDSNSTFVRSVASGRRFQTAGNRASLLSPIGELLEQFRAGRLDSYYEVIRMSH